MPTQTRLPSSLSPEGPFACIPGHQLVQSWSFLCCLMNMKCAQCSHQADTFFKVQVFPTTFVSATITFSTSGVWRDKNFQNWMTNFLREQKKKDHLFFVMIDLEPPRAGETLSGRRRRRTRISCPHLHLCKIVNLYIHHDPIFNPKNWTTKWGHNLHSMKINFLEGDP